MAQNYFKCNTFFCFFLFSFQNFEHFFEIYIRVENLKQPNYKKQSIETKYLNNTQKKHILKGKEQLFRIRKRFYRIKRWRIKTQRTKKYKRNRRLFFKPIIVTIDNMDRFEQKEMKKRDACKKNWRWF